MRGTALRNLQGSKVLSTSARFYTQQTQHQSCLNAPAPIISTANIVHPLVAKCARTAPSGDAPGVMTRPHHPGADKQLSAGQQVLHGYKSGCP
jgi:hypothetical protein